jgi:hypothetical protein
MRFVDFPFEPSNSWGKTIPAFHRFAFGIKGVMVFVTTRRETAACLLTAESSQHKRLYCTIRLNIMIVPYILCHTTRELWTFRDTFSSDTVWNLHCIVHMKRVWRVPKVCPDGSSIWTIHVYNFRSIPSPDLGLSWLDRVEPFRSIRRCTRGLDIDRVGLLIANPYLFELHFLHITEDRRRGFAESFSVLIQWSIRY